MTVLLKKYIRLSLLVLGVLLGLGEQHAFAVKSPINVYSEPEEFLQDNIIEEVMDEEQVASIIPEENETELRTKGAALTVTYNNTIVDSDGYYYNGAYYGNAEKIFVALNKIAIIDNDAGTIHFQMMTGVELTLNEYNINVKFLPTAYHTETDIKKIGLRKIDPSLGFPLIAEKGSPIMINLALLDNIFDLEGKWDSNARVYSLKTSDYKPQPQLQPQPKPQQQEKPYYILVEKSKFKMSIYALDDSNEYSILAREIKVAIGRTNRATPVGTHKITKKEEWHAFNNGWYAKYACQYAPGLYIHSELYRYKDLKQLSQNSRNQIGTKATSGCLRTYLADVNWVYDNCPIGTVVKIVE